MTDGGNSHGDPTTQSDTTTPSPQVADLAASLQVLGLDAREAEAYLLLLQHDSAEVRTLAPSFQASRSSLYRILDRLCERGFAVKTLDSPKEYAAVEPQTAFEGKLQELQSRRKEVETVRTRLADRLHELQTQSSGAPPTDRTHWDQLGGVRTVFEALARVVDQAETSIRIASVSAGTWHLAEPVVEAFWRHLRQRSKTVETECLIDAEDPRATDLTEGRPPERLSVRYVDRSESFFFVLVDDAEVVVWVQKATQQPTSEDSYAAVHTNAPGIVTPLELLFEMLWAESEPAATAAQDDPA